MSERYYCANYACPSRLMCMRFVNDERPLEKLSKDKSHVTILKPFTRRGDMNLFYPDNTGKCKSFILDRSKKLSKDNPI